MSSPEGTERREFFGEEVWGHPFKRHLSRGKDIPPVIKRGSHHFI